MRYLSIRYLGFLTASPYREWSARPVRRLLDALYRHLLLEEHELAHRLLSRSVKNSITSLDGNV
jgi:hypothetical protein